jgi:hypothetical protein
MKEGLIVKSGISVDGGSRSLHECNNATNSSRLLLIPPFLEKSELVAGKLNKKAIGPPSCISSCKVPWHVRRYASFSETIHIRESPGIFLLDDMQGDRRCRNDHCEDNACEYIPDSEFMIRSRIFADHIGIVVLLVAVCQGLEPKAMVVTAATDVVDEFP